MIAERRPLPREHLRKQRARRGLSVRAGDCDDPAELPRDEAQKLAPGEHAFLCEHGALKLGVVGADRRGEDHDVRALRVLLRMRGKDGNPESPKRGSLRVFGKVGAGNLVAHGKTELRKPAHTDAADADKMNFFKIFMKNLIHNPNLCEKFPENLVFLTRISKNFQKTIEICMAFVLK